MDNVVVKKRYVTLIEMMIVMFLIALIIGILAYNYRGTLEEGKVFKTKIGIQKLENILDLAVAKNSSLKENIGTNWQNIVRSSPMVSNPDTLMRDGWGNLYQVTIENGEIVVRSQRYNEYLRDHPSAGGD